jgi:glycosyltransferase involved in cell wall biosynthesis
VQDQLSGILIEKDNIEELVAAVTYADTHRDQMKNYAKVSSERISRRFSFDEMLQKMDALYLSL